ncbi:hypothetical protein, partial [Thermococcus sp.]|uniref:hypothetical protein n=1 Tax=Thermococcus sp. TaxID=35749 RepID=UPI002621F3C1
RRTAGPGRPRKYGEDLKKFQAPTPESTYNRLYALKERLGVPFSELLTWLVDLAEGKIDEMELKAKVKRLKEALEQEIKEKDQLLRDYERLLRNYEKLQLKFEDCCKKLEECKNNRPKLASKWSKILLAIPKAVEEGLTWNELMRDLGILDPYEQVAVMQRFFITIDENGKIPEVIRPLQGIKELEGIVLYRENGVNVRFAKIVREDTLKAMKSLKVEVPKPAKDGQPAVEVPREKIEKSLKAWLRQYEQLASSWRTKGQAEQFLKSVGNNGLKRLVKEYGFDVVAEVVGSNADFRALFGPFLLKIHEKKLEVKADV